MTDMNIKSGIDTLYKAAGLIIVIVSIIFAFAVKDAQLAEHTKRIENVESQIAQFPKIEQNEKAIAVLDRRVTVVENVLGSMSADIAVLKSNNVNVEKKLDQVYALLNRLDSKIDKLQR
jgi:peptidoglycan hydrolase CwlO-like protein